MQVAATAASFYAAAYQTGDDIVVSYRGADNIRADMGTGRTTGAGQHALRSNARRGFGCSPSDTGRRLLP